MMVPYAGRYMTVEEADGCGNQRRRRIRKNFCVKCCVKKKYAEYREEKGDKVLTFFYEEKSCQANIFAGVGVS